MILLFAELFLLFLLGWIYVVIFKVLFVKNYKDYPPYFPTFGRAKNIILNCVSKQLEKSQNQLSVVDPGCGTASMICKLAKKFPQHHFTGIEWNWLLYHIAKFRCRKLKNVTVLYQDLFSYSYTDTDIIICFLLEPLMLRFGKKLKEETKKDLTVYSHIFRIPNLSLIEERCSGKLFSFEKVYIYKV